MKEPNLVLSRTSLTFHISWKVRKLGPNVGTIKYNNFRSQKLSNQNEVASTTGLLSD